MVRIITVENEAEFALIGHLRGWCHNGAVCAVCQAEARARAAEQRLESVISG